MSIIHYQLSISELRSLCHATPKINFYHLKNGYSAQVIRPKTTNPSDFTKCRLQRQWAHTHAQPSEVHRRMHRGTVSPLLKQSEPPKGAALRCWLKRINIRTSCLRSFSSCSILIITQVILLGSTSQLSNTPSAQSSSVNLILQRCREGLIFIDILI